MNPIFACDAGPLWRKRIEKYDAVTLHLPNKQSATIAQVGEDGLTATLAAIAILALVAARRVMR